MRKVLLAASAVILAMVSPDLAAAADKWDITQPKGVTRVIDFEVDEGTWMSVDVAPDGRWLTFDLLGHIYRLDMAGGQALSLTQDSGIALNFHPAVSPDGRRIAFISDRGGQNGLWIMDADGRRPRRVFQDDATRLAEPAWLPDGSAIVVVRAYPTPGRGWHRQNTRLWLIPLSGAAPRELAGDELAQFNGPAVAPDGRSLVFHTSYFSGNRFGTQLGHHIQRLALDGGHPSPEHLVGKEPGGSPGAAVQPANTTFVPDSDGAAILPRPSPDGRHLAFARFNAGQPETIGDHELTGRTELWIRDLVTGTERLLYAPISRDLSSAHAMYAHRVLPGYAWTPDGRGIVISAGGKIRRVDVRTGVVEVIPFRARVQRRISEPVRGRVRIEDDRIVPKFLQWPATAPDERLAFVAAGKVWVQRPGAAPTAAAPEVGGVQLTPAWTPDGRALVLAAWTDKTRGHLWLKSEGQVARRLTEAAGEYIYPAVSPDGRDVAAMRRVADVAGWDRWESRGPWEVIILPLAGGPARVVATAAAPRQVHYLADGRLVFETQAHSEDAPQIYAPFPPPEARAAIVSLVAVDPHGARLPETLAVFPARNGRAFGAGNRPLVSPDGEWIAFESGREVFVARRARAAGGASQIDPDPNTPQPRTRRVSTVGGVFPRWRSDGRLEFMSGADHVTVDPVLGRSQQRKVRLVLPKPRPTKVSALVNAKIVTLGPAGVVERGSVVMDGPRIRCVGICDLRDVDKVIDASGKVVIPGFVDVHVHDTDRSSGVVPEHLPALALQLAYGVTTVIDPATDSASAFPMADLAEAGVLVGPRIFSLGELVTASPALGFGDQLDITGPDVARNVAERHASWGAVGLKAFRLRSRKQIQQLIEAARGVGLSVTGEGGPVAFDIGAAMDGQTGWEHYIANLPAYRDVTTFLGRAGIVYSPTSGVAGNPRGGVDYFRARHDLNSDPKYAALASPEILRYAAENSVLRPLGDFAFPVIAQGLADIRAAGGRGAIGEHSEQSGIGSHWEVWSYASAMPPLEALKVASLEGAYLYGLEAEIGSIEPGKLADLIVLRADPLEDIRNTLDIEFVIKAGAIRAGRDLEPVWPTGPSYDPPWRGLEPVGDAAGHSDE